MEKDLQTELRQAQLPARIERLLQINEIGRQYGLFLNEAQLSALVAAEAVTLRSQGRLEFGEGILPRLIYAFCDSPFITRTEYFDTLEALQEQFYAFKNELNDALSDDELLEAMHKVFHGRAQGSLNYMENVATVHLIRALNGEPDDPEEDDID